MIAPSMTANLVPLECLRANESGQIQWMDGDDQAVLRLQEMGIRPGASLQMVRPGKPSLITVDGRRYSVRTDDAIAIYVEPISPGSFC